jgi:predicted PurR-regulated permease PerM
MNPVKEWLSLRIHRSGLATLITTMAAAALLGTFLTITGFILTQEATAAYNAPSRRSLEEPNSASTSIRSIAGWSWKS